MGDKWTVLFIYAIIGALGAAMISLGIKEITAHSGALQAVGLYAILLGAMGVAAWTVAKMIWK